MARATLQAQPVATQVKTPTAAKPPSALSGIASGASRPVARELREKNFIKIVSLAPEVL